MSGETAATTAVSLTFKLDGISVDDGNGGSLAFWRYSDLQAATPLTRTSTEVILRNSGMPRSSLYVQGAGVGSLLADKAPNLLQGAKRFRVVAYSLIATVAALGVAIVLLFGKFSASKTVAEWIPYATADRIGQQSVGIFGPVAPECLEQSGNAALGRILDRLESGGSYGRPFKLHVAKAAIANAFALPGRHIVLLSGLVARAQNPEEVAGIMAHEMGHGLEKDPEALFVRNIGMQTALQLLTGQSGGQSPLTFGAIILQLRYSREAEARADRHAIEILRAARIDPKPAGEFFLRDAALREAKGVMSYLATHPASEDRAKLFMSQPPYSGEPILSTKEWADARAVCGERKPKESPPQTKT